MAINTEKLSQHIISFNTRIYAILDGASVAGLRMKLYEMKPPHYCLFAGDLEPDMAEVAPYLVRLYPNTPFTDWVFQECCGNNWGIFVHSRRTLNDLRGHFRALVNVYDEKGAPMFFRYYDPRVLREFLPTCQPAELKIFFGDVESFFAESAEETLTRFSNSDGQLKQVELDVS